MSFGLNVLIVGSAAVAGCSAGWWFRHARYEEQLERMRSEVHRLQAALEAAAESTAPPTPIDVHDTVRVRAFLTQLHSLALHIAEDVDEHSTRVQAITIELDAAGHDPRDVVLAVSKLLDANARLQQKLESAESKLQQQTRQLQAQIAEARTDSLTGLANRRAFDEQLKLLELAFRQQQQPACVMMIDVDNFKAFNDLHGHRAGDEVLRCVARVLEDQLAEHAFVCRFGGEEFAALFPGANGERVRELTERARMALAVARVPWQNQSLQITACAGLAQFAAGDSAEDVLKRADAALYASKDFGRDRGHWHDGEQIHCLTALPPVTVISVDGARLPARDPLTGLSTVEVFRADLVRRLAECQRGSEPVMGLLLEIDRFSELVSDYGPVAGTTMLRATGQFLRAALREMDHVARVDAARFAVLLPAVAPSAAEQIAERLRVAIEKCKLPAEEGLLTFTASLGLAESITGDDPETFVERLEQALAAAQREGGNCTHAVFSVGAAERD